MSHSVGNFKTASTIAGGLCQKSKMLLMENIDMCLL
jgi:hypothetical protein